MASRDIKLLCAELQYAAPLLILKLKERGYDAVVCCTYRSPEEQNLEYAKGRTTSGAIVTNAKGGESPHNYIGALAFDIAVFDNGRYAGANFIGWQVAGQIGEELGLEWLGSKNSKFKDLPHFQVKNWKERINHGKK